MAAIQEVRPQSDRREHFLVVRKVGAQHRLTGGKGEAAVPT